jgi:monovalent cation:H+ antiporter-2, CPA2 family
MQNVIPILLSAIALSTVLNVLLRRANIPTVVGYIITGTALAAIFHIGHEDSAALEHIAEFGIVFLMFTIGLEFSFAKLKSMQKEVFVYGLLQVMVTAAVIAAGAAFIFAVPPVSAVIIGSALALSSTAIVLKILNESGRIKSEEGQNSVGILIFQDIAVIPILLMISLFSSPDGDIGALLGKTALNAVAVVFILYFIGRYALKWIFKVVYAANSKEIYIGLILLTVIGSSFLAHAFGFSYSLGGFIAGMMIADTMYKYQVEADLIPFRDLLLGLFFVAVGLNIDLAVVARNALTILGLCGLVMAVKALVTYAVLRPTSANLPSLKTAINLCQIGEFALVALSLMLTNRMIAPEQMQVLMVTVVISMIATPFLINNADSAIRLLFKNAADAAPADSLSLISGHVLLLGYGHLGQQISRLLEQTEIEHVIVTDGTDEYVKAREAGRMVVFGDPGDRVLQRKVGIDKAMSTIIALDDIETVKRVSAAIALTDPNISVIARVSTDEERDEIAGFKHELVLDGNTQTATMIVDQIRRSRHLAREASGVRYMTDIESAAPDAAIEAIKSEQKRLLDLASNSFNGMRNRDSVMKLKAFHESFAALSEIIDRGIKTILANPALSGRQFEAINTLLDNNDRLVTMNSALEALSRELQVLAESEATAPLAEIAVESLDAVLLTLISLASDYSEDEMAQLQVMTSSNSRGLARIRERYLTARGDLGAETRALLLSATNHMDRLRTLFGEIGNNYRKLTRELAAA